jgi:hypothetical protein
MTGRALPQRPTRGTAPQQWPEHEPAEPAPWRVVLAWVLLGIGGLVSLCDGLTILLIGVDTLPEAIIDTVWAIALPGVPVAIVALSIAGALGPRWARLVGLAIGCSMLTVPAMFFLSASIGTVARF